MVLELDLKQCIPQILFSIRHAEYKQVYGQRSGSRDTSKYVASDLCNTLLQNLVENLESINGVPVRYISSRPAPSRSRGGEQRRFRPLPDQLETFSVCGEEYTLDIEKHNKLCLLVGILLEFLPDGSILGTPLNPVVGALMFYISYM